jgi:hypothetical protein
MADQSLSSTPFWYAGGIPTPRNDNVAMVRIDDQYLSLQRMSTGIIQFGRICFIIVHHPGKAAARADNT